MDCEGEEGSEMSEVRRYMACKVTGSARRREKSGDRDAHHELSQKEQHKGRADARRSGFEDLRRGPGG